MNDFRRHDDDPLYERIQRLENHVAALETKVNTLSLEQKHMQDLFGARFTTLERSQDLTISELRTLNANLTAMASEVDKSPAGRFILAKLHEYEDGARERREAVAALNEFKQQMEGAVGFAKFVGFTSLATGASALVWVALRAFGKVP